MPTNNEETLFHRYEREEMINKKIESEINSAQTEATGASEMTAKEEVAAIAELAGFRELESLPKTFYLPACAMKDNRAITKLIELVKAEEQDAIVALINDDAAAISYQSLAQYRSALLQAIRARKAKQMNWIKTSEMPHKYAAHHPECDLRVHEGDKDYYACSCGIDQHEAPWDKLTAQGELKSLPPLPEEQG